MLTRSMFSQRAAHGAVLMLMFATTLRGQPVPRGTGAAAGRSACAAAPPPAAGDLELNAITPDSDIPSRDWQKRTSVTFINGSCDAVSIVWVDYYGRRKPYKKLAPGATYQQQTFDDNTWVIETVDSARPLGYFRSVAIPSRAVVREPRPGAGRLPTR